MILQSCLSQILVFLYTFFFPMTFIIFISFLNTFLNKSFKVLPHHWFSCGSKSFLNVDRVCLLSHSWTYLKKTYIYILHIRYIDYHVTQDTSDKLKRTKLQDKTLNNFKNILSIIFKSWHERNLVIKPEFYKLQCISYIIS